MQLATAFILYHTGLFYNTRVKFLVCLQYDNRCFAGGKED